MLKMYNSVGDAQAEAVFHFVESIILEVANSTQNDEELTLADVYERARDYIQLNFNMCVLPIEETYGEEVAKKCGATELTSIKDEG